LEPAGSALRGMIRHISLFEERKAHELPGALRARRGLRRHRLELCYGVASLGYIVPMCLLCVPAYRAFLEPWAGRVLPAGMAARLAWAPTIVVSVLSGLVVASELRDDQTCRT
jgi:hypothetical protein